MKNLKVAMKLIISFLIVVALAIAVGAVGIVGMARMNAADDQLYNGNYLPTIMAGDISQIVVEQRIYIRNFVLYDATLDADRFTSAEASLNDAKDRMSKLFVEYQDTITEKEDQQVFDALVDKYNKEWIPVVNQIQSFGKSNQTEQALDALHAGAAVAAELDTLTSQLQSFNMDAGETAVKSNTSLFYLMTIIDVAVLAVAVAAALFLAFYISNMISKPLGLLTAFMNKAGTTGDLRMNKTEEDAILKYAQYKDETGQCLGSTNSFIKHMTLISQELEAVAGGDISIDVVPLSENDTMGVSVKKMVENLNNMFSEINASTAQVSTGSKQIADGAQSLAQGSTEQAAAVEQLSSSISEIAQKTKANAEMALRAATLANTIKGNAEKGSSQMDQMMSAVKEINQASQSINKVIKVIDDIAFQTNILALNAAVEAARAGQHGKGFAVVAEEVRNLAGKSAEAAKDTGELIANSMEKAELGARIADETAASLVEIVSGINESNQLVSDIARSSEEQSEGISQINTGIDQVAQVIQQNSATAQQSAAASEEMSGQANMLEEYVARFKLRDTGMKSWELPASKPGKKPAQLASHSTEGDYGKY